MLPLLVAVAGSVGVGIATDYVFGDKNYTGREAAVDGILGVTGLGLVKGGAKVVAGVRHAHKAKRLDNAVDVGNQTKVGFAVAREGVIEIQVVRGLDTAISTPPKSHSKGARSTGGHSRVRGPPRAPPSLRSTAVGITVSRYVKPLYRRRDNDKRRKYF